MEEAVKKEVLSKFEKIIIFKIILLSNKSLN